MRYKVENKESPVIINNTEKNYIIKKTEDVIELRFDEDNQAFFAQIKNPSQHTKYLYENNRLAIALCKMNCGKDALHGHNCKNEIFINPETGDEENLPSSFVKRNKHPRWSRCGLNIAPVLDSLDDEYEIDITQKYKIDGSSNPYEIGIYDFYPEPRHTVGSKWEYKWYNSVKAVLLSSPMNLTDGTNISGCRAYRTMCKRIKIEYDFENEMIVHRKNHPKSVDPYEISVDVSQNNRIVTFNITNMNERALQAYKNNQLWIGLDFYDISFATNHNGRNKRLHSGDHWEEEGPGTESYDSRRYEYRLSSKWYCAEIMREQIMYKSEDNNTPTITYTIPTEINIKRTLIHSGIYNLLRLMHKHNDVETLDIQHRTPRLVIGMYENNNGRRLFKYNPNIAIDFTYS